MTEPQNAISRRDSLKILGTYFAGFFIPEIKEPNLGQKVIIDMVKKYWENCFNQIGLVKTSQKNKSIYSAKNGHPYANFFFETPDPGHKPSHIDYRYVFSFNLNRLKQEEVEKTMQIFQNEGLFYTQDQETEKGYLRFQTCPKISEAELKLVLLGRPAIDGYQVVKQGEYAIADGLKTTQKLLTWGAGPCTAILIYDSKTKKAGLAHHQFNHGHFNLIGQMRKELIVSGACSEGLVLSTEPNSKNILPPDKLKDMFKTIDYTLPPAFVFDLSSQKISHTSSFSNPSVISSELFNLINRLKQNKLWNKERDDKYLPILWAHGIPYIRV